VTSVRSAEDDPDKRVTLPVRGYLMANREQIGTRVSGEPFRIQNPTMPFRHEAPAEPVADTEGHDLRPDPLAAQTPAEFMQALRQFRTWSGEPGYRVMAQRTGRRCAASTLCTALGSDKLPKLETVQTIVEACNGTKADIRLYSTAWRQLKLWQDM
jgi:hypothetical protein